MHAPLRASPAAGRRRAWLASGLVALIALAVDPAIVKAQPSPLSPPREVTLEGHVIRVLQDDTRPDGTTYQVLEMRTTSGPTAGAVITAASGAFSTLKAPRYAAGDHLVVTAVISPERPPEYFVTDYVRRWPLTVLVGLFAVLTVAIGSWHGITSLIGMALSFLVIFRLVLPQIIAGADPVAAAIVGALLIVPVTFYLSHGLSRKTTVAVGGTLIALVVTGLLAQFFVEYARLTGLASEEAAFFALSGAEKVDLQGLLLAGIVIASLGVLDDITVSQASIIEELRRANETLSSRELYARAMRVGRDHIASAVNTLVLVYAGASLPLLLLFVVGGRPFLEIVNYEFIAEEIVRTLVGCVGLVLAVPFTSALAAAPWPLLLAAEDTG